MLPKNIGNRAGILVPSGEKELELMNSCVSSYEDIWTLHNRSEVA